jgi:hypothetical protein
MEAEPAGEEVLAEVRRLLNRLVERRLSGGFSPEEQAEYEQLAALEREALRILAGRPTSDAKCGEDREIHPG